MPRLRSMTELWMEADEEKLGELLIYASGKLLDDPTGGATKINKILYYSELSHVRSHGVPITGVAYRKLPQGPAPRQLVPVRDRLIENGDVILREDEYFGRPLHRLVPLRPQRVDSLSQEEMATVDEVIKALWGKTAGEVSGMSHRELGWNMVEMGEDIPLSTAYLPRRAAMSDAARQSGKRARRQPAWHQLGDTRLSVPGLERVEVSGEVTSKALVRFPPEVSSAGTPSYFHFVNGPLEAAREYFSRYFDVALFDSEGSPIRYYVTVSTFFPVMGFFAARVGDHIEILDFIEHESYWDLIEDDPDD